MSEPLPFEGVRVVDFTANMSGPYATMILGDQGADVVKIEPPQGDVIRSIGTGAPGLSAYFANLNRSKRFVGLDLQRDGSRAVVERLLDSADVVVHNFRTPVARRLGLDAASARRGRDRVIHVEISGFGAAGPYGGRPAYDHVIQALSGFASAQTPSGSTKPTLIRQGIVDKITAQAAAQAMSAALFARERTGRGRAVEVRMIDVAIAMLWPDGMMNHTVLEPERLLPPISRTFQLTETLDGHIALCVVTAKQFGNLLHAIGLTGDDSTDSAADRLVNGGRHMREARKFLGALKTDEAVELLAAHDVPAAPVVSLVDLHEHPQIIAGELVAEFDHPVLGRIRQAGPGVRFDSRGAAQLAPSALLGSHNQEVMRELGYDDASISQLLHDRVLVGS